MANTTPRRRRTIEANQMVRDEWGEKYLQFILCMQHAPSVLPRLLPSTVLQLSASPHITMKNIEDHPEIFDLTNGDVVDRIMGNQNLTYAFVKKHQEIDWDFLRILSSIDKPELLLLQGIHSSISGKDMLAAHLMRPCGFCGDWRIDTEIGIPCWCILVHLLANKSVTLEFVKKWIPNLFPKGQDPEKVYWDPEPVFPLSVSSSWGQTFWGQMFWYPLSIKTNIKTIDANPHLPWDYDGVSQNKTLSAKYLREHIDENWNWSFVSSNTALTIAIIREHPGKPWNWARISMCSSRRASEIDKNLDLPWDWSQVVTNKDIDKTHDSITKWLKVHKKSMTKPWQKQRPGLPVPVTKPVHDRIALESYLSPSRTYTHKSLNRNLRFQEVIDNQHQLWNFQGFLWNTFRVEREVFFAEKTKEYMSAYRIQQFWNKAITNPYCQIGMNRLNRDYDTLFTEEGHIKKGI